MVFLPCTLLQATGSTPVVIGWTVWQMFNSNHQWQSSGMANVVLDLKAGPGFKPPLLPTSAWTMCYQASVHNLEEGHDIIVILIRLA